MSTIAAVLLERVRTAGAVLEAHGDTIKWRAKEKLPADLLDALKASKADLLAVLTMNAYREQIRVARSWDDLRAVVTDAETVAFPAGTLSGIDVEDLARMCNHAALALPLRADPCSNCDGRDWWLSELDGGIRCRACDSPAANAEVWPSSKVER